MHCYFDFLLPQIPDFQIVVSQPKCKKMYPYEWFCGPGSHIMKVNEDQNAKYQNYTTLTQSSGQRTDSSLVMCV